MGKILKTIEYRDKQLRLVKIHIESGNHFEFISQINRVIFELPSGQFCFRLVVEFPDILLSSTQNSQPPDYLEIIVDFAKCLVLDGSYRQHNPTPYATQDKTVLITNNNEKRAVKIHSKFNWELDQLGNIRVGHPLSSNLFIEECKLARRIALKLYYEKVETTNNEIIAEAHFPATPVAREVNGLNASKYVQPFNDKLFLTYEGRQLYESNALTEDNSVFIIAACHADDRKNNPEEEEKHRDILTAYRTILEENGYTAIFQEEEEHKKSIHIDIQEYIDSCAFVVADITYDRPNCYVEIGYALARGKHVIGFMQKEYFERKPLCKGESMIPFDLLTYKIQEYPMGDTKHIRNCLGKRIETVKQRRQQ